MDQKELDDALEGAKWVVALVDNNLTIEASQNEFNVKMARALIYLNKHKKGLEDENKFLKESLNHKQLDY